MNQSDEDAIYFAALNSDESKNELGHLVYSKAFKVAIRAAYAKGAEDAKERAAKHCQDVYDDAYALVMANSAHTNYYETGRMSAADMCRTHITEGS